MSDERFLSRWSRLKRNGDDAPIGNPTAEPPKNAENLGDLPGKSAVLAPQVLSEHAVTEPPALPAVNTLTPQSDFAPFMQPKVPDALKREALKKLFTDPHFNKMDGLDVYIDDYSVSTPIPDDWYDSIPSWQAILNPKEMVITSSGYAVEADSEEGKAVIAARERAQAQPQTLAQKETEIDTETNADTETAEPVAVTIETNEKSPQ